MNRVVLSAALLACFHRGTGPSHVDGGQASTSSTLITNADVDKVLKDEALGDHTIKVMEMGQGYQMSVAVVSRAATNAPAPAPTAAQQAAAAAAKQPACGLSAPAGAKLGPKGDDPT